MQGESEVSARPCPGFRGGDLIRVTAGRAVVREGAGRRGGVARAAGHPRDSRDDIGAAVGRERELQGNALARFRRAGGRIGGSRRGEAGEVVDHGVGVRHVCLVAGAVVRGDRERPGSEGGRVELRRRGSIALAAVHARAVRAVDHLSHCFGLPQEPSQSRAAISACWMRGARSISSARSLRRAKNSRRRARPN